MSVASYKSMTPENVRKILRLQPQVRKELNEAFGLFIDTLQSGVQDKIVDLRYPTTDETPPIERDLFKGTIHSADLKTIIRALGCEPRRDELKQLLSYVNSPDNIDVFQFLLIMIKKMEAQDTNEELLKAFRLFDKIDTGFIGIDELKALSDECGYDFSEKEMKQMIDEADRDQDGMVNEEEFLRVMRYEQ